MGIKNAPSGYWKPLVLYPAFPDGNTSILIEALARNPYFKGFLAEEYRIRMCSHPEKVFSG
jgi:hypothetical protein